MGLCSFESILTGVDGPLDHNSTISPHRTRRQIGWVTSICSNCRAWGFLAFLLNFVPSIGSILAAIPPVLLALVQPELGVGTAVAVASTLLAINFVIGNVMEPRFMGRGLDLSSLVVFLSLLFWGWVLGPIGMLLSVPLTATVKIILEAFPEGQPIARLLGAHIEPA